MSNIINWLLKCKPVAWVLNPGYNKKNLEKGQKVGIVPGTPNRLGDMVMNNHFIKQLQKDYQVSYIVPDWFYNKHQDFLQNHCLASEILIFPTGWWKRLRFSLHMRYKNFKALVLMPNSPQFIDRCLYAAGIPAICGVEKSSAFTTHHYNFEKFINMNHYTHVAACILDALNCSYTDQVDSSSWLPFKKMQFDELAPNNSLNMAMHIGGANYWMRKWPFGHYFDICALFMSTYRGTLYLVGGKDEYANNERLKKDLVAAGYSSASIVNFCGADLNKISNVLYSADVFFGNDSGPMHLATALRKRVACIFGPSDMPFVSPQYVAADNLAIRSESECVACNSPTCKLPAEKQYNCLNDLSVDFVWQKLVVMLEDIKIKKYGYMALDNQN